MKREPLTAEEKTARLRNRPIRRGLTNTLKGTYVLGAGTPSEITTYNKDKGTYEHHVRQRRLPELPKRERPQRRPAQARSNMWAA